MILSDGKDYTLQYVDNGDGGVEARYVLTATAPEAINPNSLESVLKAMTGQTVDEWTQAQANKRDPGWGSFARETLSQPAFTIPAAFLTAGAAGAFGEGGVAGLADAVQPGVFGGAASAAPTSLADLIPGSNGQFLAQVGGGVSDTLAGGGVDFTQASQAANAAGGTPALPSWATLPNVAAAATLGTAATGALSDSTTSGGYYNDGLPQNLATTPVGMSGIDTNGMGANYLNTGYVTGSDPSDSLGITAPTPEAPSTLSALIGKMFGGNGSLSSSPISNLTGLNPDLVKTLGGLTAAGIGYRESDRLATTLQDIANQNRSERAPFLTAANTYLSSPEAWAAGPGKSSLDATLRALSVNGNPIGNSTSLAIASDVANKNWLNGVSTFANLGLGGQSTQAGLQTNAAQADANKWSAVGAGIGDLTTPTFSLSDLLKQAGTYGKNNTFALT